MKFSEIAKRIDKSSKNADWVYLGKIAQELGVYGDIEDSNQKKIEAYWLGRWYCTDSYVGYRIYFFENEPCALSIQSGRKMDEEFHWVDNEIAERVKDFILSKLIKEELSVNIMDKDEDLGDSFKIEFNSHIIDFDQATINGESVEIVEKFSNHPLGIDRELRIEHADGGQENVNVRDLEFKFNLK